MNLVELIEKDGLKADAPKFNVGDTVRVHFKIVEGTKERIQIFEGLVIARKNGGIRETFTVRKISFGVGVERTFPVHSPRIEKVEVTREGDVRRAKLYYIRDLTGKAATKVKEKRNTTVTKKAVKTADEKLAEVKSNKAKVTTKKSTAQTKATAKKDTNKITAADKRKTARAEVRNQAKMAEEAAPVATAESTPTEEKSAE